MEVSMKTINCWDDLTQHGIVPLTGEACGLMYRILCDVTASGKRLLEKAFAVADLGLNESWNRGSEDDAHVGSIMMPHDFLPFVGIFALLEDRCPEVWLTKGNGLVGIEESDAAEEIQRFKQFHARDLVRRFAYSGTAGDRNRHMMSGRVS
jgi:hypothetical protein